ncbi:Crp/Fnr family transcriptional regulator [Occallatibacter riparius]|uniref:Crp/Fnr family transcriptional regulator n=1 Tax=Occallatibacter riparius TaxID=1002689 RepID=A0A9J7BRP1_9BACT|nr:Crp/Fnr family transcriptional regulator [Occallatibacter riparius]UWZ85239.1 Crp/Fnr family transcriptional regulator [Occallatibacter riparius]
MPAIRGLASGRIYPESRLGELFKGLSGSVVSEFESLARIETYFPGEILYEETQEPSHLLALLEGRVKLSMASCLGKRFAVRIVKRGELLGLTEVLSGNRLEFTAEALCKCRIALVHRNEFRRILMHNPNAYGSLVHDIGRDYKYACDRLRMVGRASSVQIKLARFLLDSCETGLHTKRGIRLYLAFTQREIGEFLGVSRETISRAMRELQRLRLVHLSGPLLLIPNRIALAHYAELHGCVDEHGRFPAQDLSTHSRAVRSSKAKSASGGPAARIASALR